jgi:mitogen-activated protein kinase kinase
MASSKVKPRNIKNLTLPSPKLASKPASSAADAQVPGSRASRNLSSVTTSVNDTIKPSSTGKDLSEQMATLEIGVEFKLDLRAEDLKTIERLGAGNGGTVSKVEHIPTKTVMAKKVGSRFVRGLI